jgi:hypothetical protein
VRVVRIGEHRYLRLVVVGTSSVKSKRSNPQQLNLVSSSIRSQYVEEFKRWDVIHVNRPLADTERGINELNIRHRIAILLRRPRPSASSSKYCALVLSKRGQCPKKFETSWKGYSLKISGCVISNHTQPPSSVSLDFHIVASKGSNAPSTDYCRAPSSHIC